MIWIDKDYKKKTFFKHYPVSEMAIKSPNQKQCQLRVAGQLWEAFEKVLLHQYKKQMLISIMNDKNQLIRNPRKNQNHKLIRPLVSIMMTSSSVHHL